ncbi:MAG: hypothetical protein H9W81_03335 [Enterococcus sp.]|nr:hypothetical protein [Enterococcus sp.]
MRSIEIYKRGELMETVPVPDDKDDWTAMAEQQRLSAGQGESLKLFEDKKGVRKLLLEAYSVC